MSAEGRGAGLTARLLPYLALAGLGVALDQLTKWLVFDVLSTAFPIRVISGFLSITKVRNAGGVFGVFPGNRAVFTVLSLAALVLVLMLMVKWLRERPRVGVGVALAAVLAGAVGNLVDRFWLGEVRDFIDVNLRVFRWPTFNLADIFITVGAIALGLLMIFECAGAKDSQREKTERD